jgi:hypothetical protein
VRANDVRFGVGTVEELDSSCRAEPCQPQLVRCDHFQELERLASTSVDCRVLDTLESTLLFLTVKHCFALWLGRWIDTKDAFTLRSIISLLKTASAPKAYEIQKSILSWYVVVQSATTFTSSTMTSTVDIPIDRMQHEKVIQLWSISR